MLYEMLLAVVNTAQAGKASQTFPTTEGFTLTVERKGRTYTHMYLSTSDKAEDISCRNHVWDSTHFLRPIELALYLKTAGKRANTDNEQGPVVTFGISSELTQYWIMIPNMCAIGITSQQGAVAVILANMGKMNGRAFTLTPETAESLGSFIASIP